VEDPLGPPSVFRRERTTKRHLQDHATSADGVIIRIAPYSQRYRPDGTAWMVGGDATIAFKHGFQQYKVTAKFPTTLQGLLRSGQTVTVVYCPYYPDRLYGIIWD
jgi:hypothetical protein